MADQEKLNRLLVRESQDGRTDGVKLLLEVGADVHARGDWALCVASENGRTAAVKALLDAGADVHAQSDHALRYARWHGHTETVKLLEAAMAAPARPPTAATPQIPAP
jgi:serine/threonine-protein phosphatase 6 regulatory ankyrin repeat subunit B